MGYTTTTPIEPTSEPVTAAEVMTQARIGSTGDTAEDLKQTALIEGNITAARVAAERSLNRSMISQGNRLIIDCFPSERMIQLPRMPLISVESVNYIDADGDEQVLPASGYGVANKSEPGSVFLLTGASWPEVRVQPEAVWIDFTAGYADAAAVPQPLKNWILACGALADNLREVDVLSLMPISQLNMYYRPMRQRFRSVKL